MTTNSNSTTTPNITAEFPAYPNITAEFPAYPNITAVFPAYPNISAEFPAYPNSTHNGIQSDVERLTWAAWLAVIFTCSLVGDIAILVASVKYRAFKLHTLMVAFIQHISVCDLLISVFVVFPTLTSLLANKWIFGNTVCHVTANFTVFGVPASSLLTCSMTASKLWLLRYPLKAKSLSEKQAHFLCGGIWVLSLIPPSLYLGVDKDDVGWKENIYSCYYKHSSPSWDYLEPINHGVFGGVPVFIVIICSVLLITHLREARRVSARGRGAVRWQGIVTVVAVATVFIIAVFPLTVYWICETYLKSAELYDLQASFSRTATTLFYLNVAPNVFLYFSTVKSFRRFLCRATRCRFHSIE